MPITHRPEIDLDTLLAIIARHLGEDASFRLDDILSDPLADLTHGQAAILGGALISAGNALTKAVKIELVGCRKHDDAGVAFAWVDPIPPKLRVDTRQVQKEFPSSDYPELYAEDKGRVGYVTVTLPWKAWTQ